MAKQVSYWSKLDEKVTQLLKIEGNLNVYIVTDHETVSTFDSIRKFDDIIILKQSVSLSTSFFKIDCPDCFVLE